MNKTEFLNTMAPYARRASQETNVPVELILAQWGIESAWGTSKGFRARNNVGGISYGSSKPPTWSTAVKMDPRPANEGGYYMVYSSIDDYVTDYVRVMKNTRYNPVRAAGATATLVDDARALGVSGYAAGQYKPEGGQPGDSLIATIRANELWKYRDGSMVALNTTPVDGIAKLREMYTAGSSEITTGKTNPGVMVLMGGAAVVLLAMLSE